MGRPSVKAQRTTEILDAFERCIATYGFEGASLQRIAEEAKVRRPVIRHFIGNRDAVIEAMATRLINNFCEATDALFAALPECQRVEALLGSLFDAESATDPSQVLMFESLIAASPRYPLIRQKLRKWIEGFVERMTQEMVVAYPNQTPQNCWTVAYAITALYFNLDSLSPLNLDKRYRDASIDAALALLRTLEPSPASEPNTTRKQQ